MLNLKIHNETSKLKAVVLGTAKSNGPIPKAEDAYDPNSLMHINAGTYPKEADMVIEMEGFSDVLKKYGVEVYRPEIIEDCNQIFSRDIAFVIEDYIFRSNILPHREEEFDAILHVMDQINPNKIIRPPEEVHIEGGDVMPWFDYIFVGVYTAEDYPDYITARTNRQGVAFLESFFPEKKVKSFELKKSNTNPAENALHLDCCFQPIGTQYALAYPEGFLNPEEYQWILDHFGSENVFEITKDELVMMGCNVFSIAPTVVVSEKRLTRINDWMRSKGFTVEEITYSEIAKQGGMLRCSTLPLIRN